MDRAWFQNKSVGLAPSWRVSHFVPTLALGLAVFAATPVVGVSAESVKPATISVTGTGLVSVAPDIAMLDLGVLREAKTAREALSANNKAMADVIDAMKAEGIAEKDLQTSNFNISPRYHYPKQRANGEQAPPVIVGYQVSNNLTVRLRDLAKVGAILDKVVTLGMNSGGGIRFSNDDPKAALSEARKNAMRDAIEKATVLTQAAGIGLKSIVSISESGGNRPRPVAMARSLAADAPQSVPIQGGENQYSVSVSVTWELAQ